jgi:hypothetical protein
MGNSCFCDNIHFIKDVKLNVCFQKQDINIKSDQILKDDQTITNSKNKEKDKNKNKVTNKMNEIINYFNEGEKEILDNFKKKEKVKKIPQNKKLDNTINAKDDNKYELMLKRLLEQQNIKKIGPKRRETIRKDGDNIKEMVKNLLIENKNDILNSKNKSENNTLLIKKAYNTKGRFSVTLDRNILFMNNLNNNKKKFQEQYFNNRNTICEVDLENNGLELRKQKSNESND